MKIKDRLALYFTLVSTITLSAVLFAIYFIFIKFLESDFYDRLNDRAFIIAKLYLEADEISSDSLQKVRNEYLETLHGEIVRVYDSKNKARFIKDNQQFWTRETINQVRKAKKIRFKEGLRQTVGIFYKDNQGDFVILASAIDQSTYSRIGKLKTIMLATFFIITLGLLLSSRWIANRILRPLDIFINDVKGIKSSNLHFRVREGKNKDEINLLAQNFNQLMAHLEQAFVLQKTFVANASHELRTPITSLLMSAELALSQNRSTADYQKALQSVIEDAEKMDAIINSLFNLAQADLEFGSSTTEHLRIDELLWELQSQWNHKNSTGKLFIEIADLSENPNDLILSINKNLLEIALNNIIINAFKFSGQQDVHCLLKANEQYIQIEIKDVGIGIDESDRQHLFKPFYTSSKQNAHKGNGMGLYMAQKIITLAKGHLDFISSNGLGTTFIVKFNKF
ncbi:HAMP domain-containing sensor histidine kinase [Pedobacter sp. ASV28]|uniref:sensor histidine kinase n=1 Tax=Pedobacter sp. ASV28 TaxID=2795123 RepID=UPI0018ED9D12|nr:HAMP domain-containing sensor histidine kinase [Pedobacter sp. ASV28]